MLDGKTLNRFVTHVDPRLKSFGAGAFLSMVHLAAFLLPVLSGLTAMSLVGVAIGIGCTLSFGATTALAAGVIGGGIAGIAAGYQAGKIVRSTFKDASTIITPKGDALRKGAFMLGYFAPPLALAATVITAFPVHAASPAFVWNSAARGGISLCHDDTKHPSARNSPPTHLRDYRPS